MSWFQDHSHQFPPVIARKNVTDIFGGTISPKALANADAEGTGPLTRFKVGKTVVYPRESLLAWLDERSR